VSKKSDLISRLLEVHAPRRPVPKSEVEGFDLVQQGLYMVLLRHMTEQQAEASVRALQKAYEDWNELRVCQTQEIAQHFRTSTRKKGTDKLISFAPIALELKDYLQEIYQQTHSMSLERFLADPSDGWKMLEKMPVTGVTGGAYLAFVAKKEVPVFPSLVKLLDKLGLVAKPGPGKKAQDAIGALVPEGKAREFTIAIYDVLEYWDDPKEPSYVRYQLLQETAHGKKSLVERDSAIAKAEAQRKKDEERRKKDEEKERARLAGEEKKRLAAEKQREKAAEAARAKAAKEAERKAKEAAAAAAKKAEAAAKEAQRKADVAAAAAAKKAEAAAKEAARKAEIQKRKAEAEAKRKAKEAEAKQRAADKKAALKKAAAEKQAALKKAAADKKAAAQKAKKPAAKTVKPAAKKPAKPKPAKPAAKAKKAAKPAKKPAKR
jgi:hypothetical protein